MTKSLTTTQPDTPKTPDWADPTRSEFHPANDFHYAELRRWSAAEDDVDIRLELTRTDEHVVDPQRTLIVGRICARLRLESTAYICHTNPDGTEVAPSVDVDLTADDCRRLAAHLLMSAERIENLDGAR